MFAGILLCNQAAVISYKTFSTVSKGNQQISPAFMAFWTGILGCVLLAAAAITGDHHVSSATLVAVLAGGLSFSIAGILLIRVMSTGPFIWSVLIINLSNFLPVLFALFFLGEAISISQTVGVILILSILFVMNIGLKKDDRPFTTVWMVLAIVNMFANGSVLSAQKAQSHFTNGGETLIFLSLMFLFASLLCLVYTFMTINLKDIRPFRPYLPPAFSLVAAIGFSNFLTLLLMVRIPAAVQFPVVVGCGIILSSIVSVVFYKERPGIRLYVSAALLIAGVILLGF